MDDVSVHRGCYFCNCRLSSSGARASGQDGICTHQNCGHATYLHLSDPDKLAAGDPARSGCESASGSANERVGGTSEALDRAAELASFSTTDGLGINGRGVQLDEELEIIHLYGLSVLSSSPSSTSQTDVSVDSIPWAWEMDDSQDLFIARPRPGAMRLEQVQEQLRAINTGDASHPPRQETPTAPALRDRARATVERINNTLARRPSTTGIRGGPIRRGRERRTNPADG